MLISANILSVHWYENMKSQRNERLPILINQKDGLLSPEYWHKLLT